MRTPKLLVPQNLEIEAVVRDCARQIEDAIRRAVAERLDEAVAQALKARGLAGGVAAAPARAARMCPVSGCGLPAAGPKYRWRCRAHKDVATDGLASQRVAAPAPRITRLPPGPGPDRPRRAGPPMDCRAPGCLVKSRGPRYDYFCGDHFRAFPLEKRREYAEQWKAARAAAKDNPRPTPENAVRLRRGSEFVPVDLRAGEPVVEMADPADEQS